VRVLMLTDFYWPYVGGVEQHVRRLSQALSARGHEVAVVTLGNGRLAEFEQDGPVRVYRVRSTMQRASWLFAHPDRTWAPPFPDPEVTHRLGQILREECPDIVHGHDWLARAFLPLKAGSRARFVMSLHYYTLSCAKKSLMFKARPCAGPGFTKCLGCAAEHYGLAKGPALAVANWTLSAAERAAVDLFLPVSQATAAGNGLSDDQRYEVIPNFMPDHRGPTGDQSAYTAQLPDTPFLLFVGDLRRDKGIHVLLAAYAGLTHPPPLVLLGKVWADTPAVWPANVIVLRDWPNEAVLAAWQRSLMGIVPSLWPEPFGIVVIEAMASGRPVIASRIGGMPDILNDGEAGLLVPPGDVLALQRAIERLLTDAELREGLGQAAKRRAEAFEAATVVPRIERVYARLLRRSVETHEPAAAG
jgi:glycosyltransferase involved in cell wall biosynthesis